MDKFSFIKRPYHVKEEDKKVLDKEIKRLVHLGILKEGLLAYSRPVLFISRKVTQDKRCVSHFRHINTRIAKTDLAFPSVRDTFSLLGSAKCDVLSVIYLKDAFHSLRLTEESKTYCGILPYTSSASFSYQGMPI